VSGTVAGDLLAMSGRVRVLPGASVGGTTLAGGREVDLAGTFTGPVRVGAGQVVFSGTAEGDVRIDADVIEFEKGAQIKGNLTYSARNELDILREQEGSGKQIVAGSVTFVPRAPKEKRSKGSFHYFFKLWTFASAFLLGCLIILFARGTVRTITQTAQSDTLKSLGFGVLGHIFAPFAGVILLVLCLTFPAGALVLIAWAVLFYLAKLVVSLALADGVLRRMGVKPSPYLALLLGMIPVWLLFMVPVLGSLLYWFVVPIFGIGAILIGVRTHSKKQDEDAPPPEAPSLPI